MVEKEKNLTKDKQNQENKLWEKLKKECNKIEYGSLTLIVNIHQGTILQMEVSDVKVKIR